MLRQFLHTKELQWLHHMLASSPQAPRSFQRCMRKEGKPGKTYHVHDVRWNQLPYMVQQRVGWLERRISHRKFEFFDLNVTISYESASGGPSVPLLRVENYDLHGNSIVPTSKSVSFHLGMNTIELPCKSQFSTRSEGTEGPPLADCNVQVEEVLLNLCKVYMATCAHSPSLGPAQVA